MGSDAFMTKPIGMRAFSILFAIFLVSIAFMPVVSAQSIEYTPLENSPVSQKTEINESCTDNSRNISVRSPAAVPVVFGIFAIPITSEIAAYLGLTGLIAAIVLYSDGKLSFVKDNDYVKIDIIVVNTFINAALNELGLRSANSYEDAYRKGLPTDNHEVIKKDDQHRNLPSEDGKNSSKDLVDSDGKLLQRRYYNNLGKAEVDWDYNHDHGKGIPHQHRFIYNPDGTIKERINIKFNPDGSETNT
jgi:hypothetical protein